MIWYETRKDNEKKKKRQKRRIKNNKVYEEADDQSRQKSRRAVNKYEIIFGSIGFGWHLANGEWRKYVSLFELMEKTNFFFTVYLSNRIGEADT